MRRQITYIPEYQVVAILFNANIGIIPLACAINDLIHCDLSYTGDLDSMDSVLSIPFKFITFSNENAISKTTLFLLNNKSLQQVVSSSDNLFSKQELIVNRYLIGNKNSIYSHKDLLSSDYCLLISYPLGQIKPEAYITKIMKMNLVKMAIEIEFNRYKMFESLSQDVELYIDDYNRKCKQQEAMNKRKLLIQNRAKLNGNATKNDIISQPIFRKL